MQGLHAEDKVNMEMLKNENVELKNENVELKKENERLKKITKDVLDLISKYTEEGGMNIEQFN